jgi:hypothetical protein
MMENINDRLRLGIQGNYDARLGNAPPASARAVTGALSNLFQAGWDFVTYRSNAIFLLRYWVNQMLPGAKEQMSRKSPKDR